MGTRQEKLLKFHSCPGCKRVLRRDEELNSPEELKKVKQKDPTFIVRNH